ncbi:MAG: ThiF family adenylyltransferase [Pseudomonadota bacterium]
MSNECLISDKLSLSKNVEIVYEGNNLISVMQSDLSIIETYKCNVLVKEIFKLLHDNDETLDNLFVKLEVKNDSLKKEIIKFLFELEKKNIIENKTKLERTRPAEINRSILERYSSQFSFFSSFEKNKKSRFDFQKDLIQSKILILGIGGIGSIVFEGLLRSGVNNFILYDYDKVEVSNLNRQIVYTYDDIGKYKVDVAIERAKKINSDCRIKANKIKIDRTISIETVIKDSSLVIVCCDEPNIEDIVDIVNPACVKYQKSFIVGGGYSAHIGSLPITIIPKRSICWNCYKNFIYRNNTIKSKYYKFKNTTLGSSIMPTAGIIANYTIIEAIKVITGYSKPNFTNVVSELSFTDMKVEKISISPDKKCQSCRNF